MVAIEQVAAQTRTIAELSVAHGHEYGEQVAQPAGETLTTSQDQQQQEPHAKERKTSLILYY